jgi:hypothetical protein
VQDPEENLESEAIEEIVDWLRRLSLRTRAVVASTQHSAALSSSPRESTLVHVHRRESAIEVMPLTPAAVELVDGVARSVQAPRAALLTSQVVLFIEADTDFAMLDCWVGQDLRGAHVTMVPAGQSDLSTKNIDVELLTRLGISVAALPDHAAPAEGSMLQRIRTGADACGATLHEFELYKRDPIEYLASDACREHAPRFPDWMTAVAEWKQTGSPTDRPVFRHFVADRYGLVLDPKLAHILALRTAQLGQVPDEIRRLANEIITLAAQPIDSHCAETLESDHY